LSHSPRSFCFSYFLGRALCLLFSPVWLQTTYASKVAVAGITDVYYYTRFIN
jgi:hypothetical protein